MANYSEKYGELFDYLSAEETPDHKTGVVVFGRADTLLSTRALDLVGLDLASWMIITGGHGKDSKDLKVPEAEFIASSIEEFNETIGLSLPPLFTEPQATNGGENSRNSLTIMRRGKLDVAAGVTAVAHATSSRRLGATLEHAAHKQGIPLDIYRVSTNYNFDAENPNDQKESVDEMLRLAQWPAKDWLLPQPDLPADLVDFAYDIKPHHL